MIVEAVLFVGLIIVYLIIQDRKPKGMPPGPFEIPFIGNTFIIEDYQLEPIKKYGPVVTTRLGVRHVVVFDYQIGKEAMASQDFANRPAFFAAFSIDPLKKAGVASANGEQWVNDRRFVLRHLRNHGMGKAYLEGAIHIEAQELIEDLKSYEGKPAVYPTSLKTAGLNIIWQMVAGKRYDLRSKDVLRVYEATEKILNETSPLFFISILFPILDKICPKIIKEKVFKTHMVDEFNNEFRRILDAAVAEHENKMSADEEDNDDFLTAYQLEMKKCEKEANPMFYRGGLLQNINDLFQAGSDTIYYQLRWTVYLMAKYPELTARMQNQIDEHVPKGRLVSIDDKPNLPLVEAFVTEAYRYGSITALNPQREAVRDTHIGEFFIPKGTLVSVATISVHRDPKYWENPEQFYPERFLTAEGKFQAPKEGFFSFGSGRRVCVGETLARTEYYIFSAVLIQNFNICVPEGSKISDKHWCRQGLRYPQDEPFIYKYRM